MCVGKKEIAADTAELLQGKESQTEGLFERFAAAVLTSVGPLPQRPQPEDMMVRCPIARVAVVCLMLGGLAHAQTPKPAAATISFDHLNDGDLAYEANVSHGQTISVEIKNTCESVFAYTVRGIVRAEPAERVTTAAGTPLATKTLTIPHDEQYGGYIVSITRTSDAAGCVNGEKLRDRTIIISTPKLEWDIAFSGGFTISNLTNPVYSTRDHPTVAGKKQVQENVDARDSVNLGIGAFVHLYHRRLPMLGGVFGLGIREGNKTEYLLGGGLRFSDKATLNAGVAFGPVKRLPNNVNTTDPVDDASVLTDLPTRVKTGFFVGITYSFINVRDRFQQPFAGTQTATTPPATPPRTATAACSVTLTPAEVKVGAAGGDQTVAVVTTPANCDWKPTSPEADWVAVTAPKGTTGDQIVLKITRNTGPAREHEVVIADKTLAVNQEGAK